MSDEALTTHDIWDEPIGAFKAKTTVPRGHPETPGTGPKSETCSTCQHIVKTRVGLKCKRNSKKWTAGKASNVRAKDAACFEWQKGGTDE